jgi:hypothetical protein
MTGVTVSRLQSFGLTQSEFGFMAAMVVYVSIYLSEAKPSRKDRMGQSSPQNARFPQKPLDSRDKLDVQTLAQSEAIGMLSGAPSAAGSDFLMARSKSDLNT